MIVTVFIAIAAGAASALMFASLISGALISLLLFYLAPLPLMVAAMGWGPLSATLGGITAATGLGAIFGLPSVGRVLLWIAGFAALTTTAAVLTLGADAATIAGTLRRGWLTILGLRDAPLTGETEQLIDALVTIAPAAAAIFATTTLSLNLWLAAKITATSGRLHRPWPDLNNAALPPMTLAALCAVVAFCTIMVVFVWPVIAMVVLGLADALFGLRRRFLQGRPPPLPAS